MKLKLDLHPIFSDSAKIEASLAAIIDEACEKRAAEVEIIPGKGSGALKKTVLRFLDRPDVKARYHRIDKDSDNFGRLFVYFRWDKESEQKKQPTPKLTVESACFCCGVMMRVPVNEESGENLFSTLLYECRSCGSPNKIALRRARSGLVGTATNGYE